MRFFLILTVLIATGCQSTPEPQSSGMFGPPATIQGIAPNTGMSSFKADSNWGPGTTSPQPGLPANWNGGFRGY